jgi:hypothetical protein
VYRHVLSLIKLILTVVIVAHIVSILWHGLGIYEISMGVEDTWMKKAGIDG